MEGFEPLEGDSGRIKNGAACFGAVGADLEDDLRSATAATQASLESWRARRADTFRGGMFGIEAELGMLAATGPHVSEVLREFAQAWTSCDDHIEDCRRQASRIQRELDDRSPGMISADVEIIERLALEAQIAALRVEAEDARRRLAEKAAQVAEVVDSVTRRLVPGGDRLSPDDLRRRVDAATGVLGTAGPVGDAWTVLGKARAQATLVLDLAVDNIDALRPGGPVTSLPVDAGILKQLVDAARLDGVPLWRCRALLHQYWAVKAANAAGIALDSWDPALGVDGNLATISAVYRYYGRLFLRDPAKFQWAGMANMIGPSFAGGFLDLDLLQDIAAQLLGPAEKLPDWAKAVLPPQLRALDAVGNLSADELGFYERTFLSMQKKIFFDQGAMHQAYVEGGMREIKSMWTAGIIDHDAFMAWTRIRHGAPDVVAQGNKDLLRREQNQIINKKYDQMREHHGAEGEAVTYLMTVVGEASIPGTVTPGEFSPLDFRADQSAGLFGVGGGTSVEARTPLPDFNISDKDHRWHYVENDTLPAYQRLLREKPDLVRQVVASNVDDRIAQQRLSERWPRVAEHLIADWDIEVHVGAHAGPLGFGL